jgi:hypothetical protein
MQPVFMRAQRLDHLGPDLAGQQRQHVGTAHLVPERTALDGEGLVEGLDPELAALELGPRVVVRVGRVDGAQEVRGQAAGGLVARERLEGARRDHAAEVPDDGLDVAHRFTCSREKPASCL